MAIDPLASGAPSPLHVGLPAAGQHARALREGSFARALETASSEVLPPASPRASRPGTSAGAASRAFEPHTPIVSAAESADPDRWDGLLNRLGQKYGVPPLFLKAVMLIESGGRPDAVGDGGHSVGLFQLHDQGYGHGMGDLRFDPEANADRAARGLAASWRKVQAAGYTGEYAVRAAYDDTFNPGGGFAYQGDALVRTYNRLLQQQGLPPLS
nr:transglycosylase SLT domain-containing protein [Tepidiforma sp.]